MLANAYVIYVYDGSYNGMLTCFYNAVYARCVPFNIIAEEHCEPSMFGTEYIETDEIKAQKVHDSFTGKLSKNIETLVRDIFMSCMKDKELALLKFLLFAYKNGPKTISMLSHPLVSPLLKAQLHLLNEVHHFKGFVRFSDFGNALVAEISPKNFVLPYLQYHFCDRYRAEDFLIYDDVHKYALIYENKKPQIIKIDGFQKPEVTENEMKYREMWREFYNVIAIETRRNERNRMSFMPKRFWSHITEME